MNRRDFIICGSAASALVCSPLAVANEDRREKTIDVCLSAARALARQLLANAQGTADDWARPISQWMKETESNWNEFPNKETAEYYVNRMVEDDDLGFFVASLSTILYSYDPKHNRLRRTSPGYRTREPIEEAFSSAIASHFVRNEAFRKRYMHFCLWARFISPLRVWSTNLCLQDAQQSPEIRPEWCRRNLLILLAVTEQLELLQRYPIERVCEGYPEWIDWMKENAYRLEYSAQALAWTIVPGFRPLWRWPDGGDLPDVKPPQLPTPDWNGPCNLPPQVFPEIASAFAGDHASVRIHRS